MKNDTANKNARLGARITPDIHTLIKRAADLRGRTVSDFVVSATRDAASGRSRYLYVDANLFA